MPWVNNISHSDVNVHKVPEELRVKFRRLISVEYDETMNDILAYIITRGPTTLYKVSRDTPHSISSIYKKAKKMVKDYLIRVVGNGNRSDSAVYEVTIKGLLLCLAHNCVDDDLVLSRLRYKWGLRNYNVDNLIPLLMLIPHVVKDDDLRVLESIDALMIMMLSILMNNQQIGGKDVDKDIIMNKGIITSVRSTSIYYIVNDIIMNNLSQTRKPDIVVGNNSYLVGYRRLDNTLYVYMCRLCAKSCLMTLIPVNSQCQLVNELNKAVINMVR
jgi:hypothetical protein